MMTEADLDLARMRLSQPEHLSPDDSYEIAADLVDEVDRLRDQRDRYNEAHLRAQAQLTAARHTEAAQLLAGRVVVAHEAEHHGEGSRAMTGGKCPKCGYPMSEHWSPDGGCPG